MSTETSHQLVQPRNDQTFQAEAMSFLELEITGLCQLKCRHCYADSGPEGGHGTMNADDWEHVIDDAHTLSIDTVQFIGGEPTLHPDLPRLIRYALGKGLKVDVYTNLVHVTPELWELFCLPRVSLGTSWYSSDPDRHGNITGSNGSHARTRTNIVEAGRERHPHGQGTRCWTRGARRPLPLGTVRTLRARSCRYLPVR